MKKYLIYLFDGTTQDRSRDESKDWSNIVRLHELIHARPPADGALLDMYRDGVGCRINEKVLGSLEGVGLQKRVGECYKDLGSQVLKARKNCDDLRLYVFGFSRGAYAARVFCELIAYCGAPGNAASFEEAMDHLQDHDLDASLKGVANDRFLPPPEIEMLGVFDTVAMTDFGKGVDISKLPNIVHHACHAMSYNERRPIFPLTRFAAGQQNVEEMWFLGSHTDVGGGYVTRGLADRSLAWMIEQANEYGLPIVEAPIDGDTANHAVKFNDSFGVLYSIAGIFKRFKVEERRNNRQDDVFHWSVQDERPQFAGVVPPLPPENMIAYSPRPSADTMIA